MRYFWICTCKYVVFTRTKHVCNLWVSLLIFVRTILVRKAKQMPFINNYNIIYKYKTGKYWMVLVMDISTRNFLRKKVTKCSLCFQYQKKYIPAAILLSRTKVFSLRCLMFVGVFLPFSLSTVLCI